jgi:hypothetical protein
MGWMQLLAYHAGSVDQRLLLRNEYLVTAIHILRQQNTGRVQLTEAEHKTLVWGNILKLRGVRPSSKLNTYTER